MSVVRNLFGSYYKKPELEQKGNNQQSAPNNLSYAKNQTQTADRYINAGYFDKAIELYSKALTIYSEIPGMYSHRRHRECHEQLGNLYSVVGDYSQALIHKEEALRISLLLYGRKHEITAAAYCSLGMATMNTVESFEQESVYDDSEDFSQVSSPVLETKNESPLSPESFAYFDWAFGCIRLRLAASHLGEGIKIYSELCHLRGQLQLAHEQYEYILSRERFFTNVLNLHNHPKKSEKQTVVTSDVKIACKTDSSAFDTSNVGSDSEQSSLHKIQNKIIQDLSKNEPVKIVSGIRSMR